MAIVEIGITGYCTAAHVQAHTGDPHPFADDTEPMLKEVEQFIRERFDRINAELEAEGYTTPFSLPVNINILQPINAVGAASDVHESRGDLRASREANEEFLTAIDRIKNGDIVLTEEATGSGPTSTDDGFLSSFSDNDGDPDPTDIAGIVREEMRKFLTGFVLQTEYNEDTGILTVTHYLGPTETYKVLQVDPPPAQQPLRYWGWADDTNITTQQLANANTSEADEGRLPRRLENGYIFFAVPEERGFPDRIYLQQRDASHYFQQQGPINSPTGDPYLVGVTRRLQAQLLSEHAIRLEYD